MVVIMDNGGVIQDIISFVIINSEHNFALSYIPETPLSDNFDSR